MTTTMNALELMDAELARAAAPRTNKKPVLLFLKENQKASIRPLYTLSQCIVLAKHNKYSENANERVNAICGHEIGKPCVYCEQVAIDKKLAASMAFYLPVYVHQVVDQGTGQQITYKDPETQQEKPVGGIRLIEMTSFGTIGQVLKAFREFSKDRENCALTECDFSFSQIGSGQKKSFVIMPKTPKAMNPKLAANIPPLDAIRARIIEALPPVLPTAMPGIDDKNVVLDEDFGDGPTVPYTPARAATQAIANGQMEEDAILEF